MVEVDLETGLGRFVRKAPADCQFLVVMPLTVPLAWPDNQIGKCAACGQGVQFRPENAGVGPMVCMRCAPAWAEGLDKPQ